MGCGFNPRIFVCMCCAAAMKHCLANNVLGISSRIQLLFPPADAASCFSLVILLYLVYVLHLPSVLLCQEGGVQPSLQYVASGMIGFVAVHRLWNVEVKQPMSEVCDCNMYGTKLKFHGWFLNTANEDGDGGEDGDGDEDDATFASEDCGDEIVSCARAVQLLAIRANFRISAINALDWNQCASIYTALEGEVQEEGMDLVLTGPYRMLEAYSSLGLEVFTADDEGSCTGGIFQRWDVTEPDEVEEFTQTIYGGLGRKLEITYLVIPDAVETHVEVRLNLKDLGSRSRAVYGSVKAIATDYGSKSVHLFSCERGRSLSLPCGSTCILPLGPHMIALPDRRHFKLHIEVDVRVVTTCDSQEEDKNLKFCLDCSRRIRSEERLEFPRRIRSQKREVDGDQVEVDVIWRLESTF